MANFVTFLRIAFALPACYLLIRGTPVSLVWAVVLLLYVELSDAIDGHVARTWGEVSDVGKLLDPLVDTLTRFTVFATFLVMGLMPLWMLLIFFYRDMVVAYLRSMAAMKNVAMGARFSGKVKALVQGIGQQVVGILLLARAIHLHGAGDPLPFFGPIVGGFILWVVILVGFKATGKMLAIILPFGLISAGVMGALWAFHPEFHDLELPVYWTLFFAAAVTAWSLGDYCFGLYRIVRKDAQKA
jgi:CDP-diacylglycerol--glycerol-3-phosphate 3-phosphatidyltransferase